MIFLTAVSESLNCLLSQMSTGGSLPAAHIYALSAFFAILTGRSRECVGGGEERNQRNFI